LVVAALTSKRLMSRRSGGAALAVIAVLVLVGCGDGDGGKEQVKGVGEVRANSTAQLASCKDWRKGTVEQRYATIRDIRLQLDPQTADAAQTELPDRTAYRIFQRTCGANFAASLLLYKLYARAQAYAPLRSDTQR
jgi:hypothetical protein